MNSQSRASRILALARELGDENNINQINISVTNNDNNSRGLQDFKHLETETNLIEAVSYPESILLSDNFINDTLLLQIADEQISQLSTLCTQTHPIHMDPEEGSDINTDNTTLLDSNQFLDLTEQPSNIPNCISSQYIERVNPDIICNETSNPNEVNEVQRNGENDSDYQKEETSTEDSETDEVVTRQRKKRRHVSTETWTVNRNKKNRQAGLQYLGKQKQEQNWNYKVLKEAKSMKERCNCTGKSALKCTELLEEQRLKLFNKFWKLSWNEKKIYVRTLLEKQATKRARHRKVETESRRQYSYIFFLETTNGKVRVCKTMFCNTLSISARTIGHWLQDETIDREVSNEMDNTENQNRANRGEDTRYASINEKKEHLKRFFEHLPKLESHYCRKSSTKLYLEPIWTSKTQLYRLYKDDWCLTNNVSPLSIAAFANIFSDLNLSLFTPKKDECDTCIAYKTNNISVTAYEHHLAKKEEARHEKEADKLDNNIKVFTMDLQSVLLSPKSNVSSLYYKTKLVCHNFTIYDLKSKDGFCFFWHEGHAGLSSNTFASILYYFLQKYITPEKQSFTKVVLYSDGCTAQNRNAILSSALLGFCQQEKITIEQKFLEKGHTQMECDSMHSTIERKVSKTIINVPADYTQVFQAARINPRPYVVEYLDHMFFKDFKKMQVISSIRPGRTVGEPTVTDIRALKYSDNQEIMYKISHGDDWKPLPCRYNKKQDKIIYTELPLLYPNPTKKRLP